MFGALSENDNRQKNYCHLGNLAFLALNKKFACSLDLNIKTLYCVLVKNDSEENGWWKKRILPLPGAVLPAKYVIILLIGIVSDV